MMKVAGVPSYHYFIQNRNSNACSLGFGERETLCFLSNKYTSKVKYEDNIVNEQDYKLFNPLYII